jgi:hypothetical protein
MLKKFNLIFLIFIFFPAFSLDASPATVRKVFEYIDARYAEPVNPSLIYTKTLDQMKKNFPGKVMIENLGAEAFRISCQEKTMDFRISGRDQVSNVRQMENVIRNCIPDDTMKRMRKSEFNDEQIVLDMLLGSLDPHSLYDRGNVQGAQYRHAGTLWRHWR